MWECEEWRIPTIFPVLAAEFEKATTHVYQGDYYSAVAIWSIPPSKTTQDAFVQPR